MSKIEENSININFVNLIKTILQYKRVIFFITILFPLTLYLTSLITHRNELSLIEVNVSNNFEFIKSTQNRVEKYNDFKKLLYNENIFKSWKKENTSSIVYADFSKTFYLKSDDFNRDSKSILVFDINEEKATLRVKSNNPLILNDFISYADYINKILSNRYMQDAESMIKLLKTRFSKFLLQNEITLKKYLVLDIHIYLYKDGENFFMISPPEEIYLHNLGALYMFLAAILGLFFAILFVIFHDSYQKKILNTKKM
tara:strand:+ start:1928 stop:2698 length:771 start_codon:yes stop_codon:yes gene_type:complete